MKIVETLAPLILLIGLGAVLAQLQFLGKGFIADLNKLAFWVALPALLFRSAANAGEPGEQTFELLMILMGVTLLACAAGFALCALFRIPRASQGTLVQCGFRGNLAYIGIPVLAFGLPSMGAGPQAFQTAVVVMTLLMVFFNFLSVPVLAHGRFNLREVAISIGTNPLLVSGLLGLGVAYAGFGLPRVADRTLEVMGGAAVPIALLCIGGSLIAVSPGQRFVPILMAAGLKVVFVPLCIWAIGRGLDLSAADLRIALVLGACPTAAAAYVMASRMGGDEPLASGAIAASTLLSAPVLFWALWVTGA
jgi:predicted permease